MSQPIRGQGGHLVFPISPKKHKLGRSIEILLPINSALEPSAQVH